MFDDNLNTNFHFLYYLHNSRIVLIFLSISKCSVFIALFRNGELIYQGYFDGPLELWTDTSIQPVQCLKAIDRFIYMEPRAVQQSPDNILVACSFIESLDVHILSLCLIIAISTWPFYTCDYPCRNPSILLFCFAVFEQVSCFTYIFKISIIIHSDEELLELLTFESIWDSLVDFDSEEKKESKTQKSI